MKRSRKIKRIVIITLFVLINMNLLYGLGQLFTFLNTGADRTSMLRTTEVPSTTYVPKLQWRNTTNPARPITEQKLQQIEKDYLQAWSAKNIAYFTNTNARLKDYYTPKARERITPLIAAQKANNYHIETTSLNHELFLDFFSADGKVVVFTDRNVRQFQRTHRQEQIIAENYWETDYRVTMLLEDGFWKIRHLEKISSLPVSEGIEHQNSESLDSIPKRKPAKGIAKKNAKRVTKKIAKEIAAVKGLNYYPQKNPWNTFGKDWNPEIIAADFAKIARLKFNTIRVFVGYEDFGGVAVKRDKLEKLKQLLDLAKVHQLKVVVTLFDFYGNYDVLDWTSTHRHAEAIVSPLKAHPAILAWDVKNEPDLDFESRGKTQVLAWLKEMIAQLKAIDNVHPITIGWSQPETASLLSKKLDFVSFHYYRSLDEFEVAYKTLQSEVKKPILLQEFGLSSDLGLWNPLGATQKQQADYYQQFSMLKEKYSIPYLLWTLYDFENIPSGVVGYLPWRKNKQKHFGLLDENQQPKKAFKVFTNLP